MTMALLCRVRIVRQPINSVKKKGFVNEAFLDT